MRQRHWRTDMDVFLQIKLGLLAGIAILRRMSELFVTEEGRKKARDVLVHVAQELFDGSTAGNVRAVFAARNAEEKEQEMEQLAKRLGGRVPEFVKGKLDQAVVGVVALAPLVKGLVYFTLAKEVSREAALESRKKHLAKLTKPGKFQMDSAVAKARGRVAEAEKRLEEAKAVITK